MGPNYAYTRIMVYMGQVIRDDTEILGHVSVSVCQYVCLCVQSRTISKIPQCPIQIILRVFANTPGKVYRVL